MHCYTPHVTIHRVKITYRKQWDFICDICWADRCVDNPHYEYGGLWMSGRVMPPESELYAEWLAKRKKRSQGPDAPTGSPPEPAASENESPSSETTASGVNGDEPAVATAPNAVPDASEPPAPHPEPQDG